MKKLSRRQMDRLMRYLINFAYAPVPGEQKRLFANSPEWIAELDKLGLSDRRDQALHVLVGYELIALEELQKSGRTVIILTNKGKAYFERKRDDRIALVCKSILIPILVSIITAAITVYILPSLGKRAKTWLLPSTQDTAQSKTESALWDGPAESPGTPQTSSNAPRP